MFIVMASCSSPSPSPDAQPETVPPIPPQTPADLAPPDSARDDTAQASSTASQDTFFEGAEHVWLDALERGVTFRAIGQEPGWLVEISAGRRLRVVTDYGADEFVIAPVPSPVVDSTTWTTTYRTQAEGTHIRIHIRDEPCADTMTGERFPATVVLVLNATSYHGCGRALDRLP